MESAIIWKKIILDKVRMGSPIDIVKNKEKIVKNEKVHNNIKSRTRGYAHIWRKNVNLGRRAMQRST